MTSMLVLRRGGLGDTLLLLPVLRALRRAHRDARLHFAGVADFAAVLHAYGAVDAAHSTEAFASWRLGSLGGEAVRARLREFALVVADDPIVATVAAAGTEVQVLDTLPRGTDPLGLQFARRLGLPVAWPDDARLLPSRAPGDGPVALAPGSGGRHKCWPFERWLELANALAVRGHCIEVVVGPTEIERDDPRQWAWPVPVAFLVENSVVALARRLETVQAFVGNDSGTTHLAALLGVPTIALFGPTDPRVWAPVGSHVHVIAGPASMDGIGQAEVVAALERHCSRARTRCQ